MFIGIISKIKGQVHRLTLVIAALERAQKIIKDCDLSNQNSLDGQFKDSVAAAVTELGSEFFVIGKDTTKRGICMAEYFLSHKKYLAGYSQMGVSLEPKNNIELLRRIILFSGQCVKANDVNKGARSVKAEDIKMSMEELTTMGLGRINNARPVGGGKMSTVFVKINVQDLNMEDTLKFTESLCSIGVKMEEYVKSFQQTKGILKRVDENSVNTQKNSPAKAAREGQID